MVLISTRESNLVTDEPGANLLTNANTIAHLFGEGIKVNNIDPDVVNNIDALISAYAYKESDSDTKKLFRDLTKSLSCKVFK